MADNVELAAGTGGAIAATDDIGGFHHQRVKISVGADGSASDAIPVSNGLDTTAAGVQAVGIVGHFDDAATGTVTENQFAPIRITSTRRVMTSADVTASALPTGASTSAKQDTIIGHVDGIEGLLAGTLTVGSHAVTNAGTFATQVDGAALTALQLIDNIVRVEDEASGDGHSGAVVLFRRTATPADTSGADLDYEVPQMSAGRVWVSATVESLPASTNTLEMVGDVAHDAAAAGNPVLVCGVAQDQDDTAPPNRVSAESDATRIATDRDGSVHVHPYGPQIWSTHVDSSSAQTDTTVHAAPGAGLSLYVTDIVFSSGAATAINLFFEEGSTKVLGPYYLEAVAGRGMSVHFQTPKKITANTALTFTTSAAIAHAVDVTGFVAQG